ncbi:TPA: hypothetical protein HA361_00670 [Candidatus Woesearchaeota archaeon]|nr:hypothetical protein [Candidatus Woesearchaeota archaeon]HII69495.1 hypothetical protein [Candidatus Woesearchaeota archaeon]
MAEEKAKKNDLRKILSEDVKEGIEKAKFLAKKKKEDAEAWIKKHPFKALGIAVGVGTLAGLLLGKRRR